MFEREKRYVLEKKLARAMRMLDRKKTSFWDKLDVCDMISDTYFRMLEKEQSLIESLDRSYEYPNNETEIDRIKRSFNRHLTRYSIKYFGKSDIL